jgi:hypothetical protein
MVEVNGTVLHLNCSHLFATKLGAIHPSRAHAGAIYMTVTATDSDARLVWEIAPKVAYEWGW